MQLELEESTKKLNGERCSRDYQMCMEQEMGHEVAGSRFAVRGSSPAHPRTREC